MRLRARYAVQHVLPEGGFKREEEVNLEEVRGNGIGVHGEAHKSETV
jgi:hypothetical protein